MIPRQSPHGAPAITDAGGKEAKEQAGSADKAGQPSAIAAGKAWTTRALAARPAPALGGYFQRSRAFSQAELFGGGACGTLCSLYLLHSMRGVAPAEIVAVLAQRRHRERIRTAHAAVGAAIRESVDPSAAQSERTANLYIDRAHALLQTIRAVASERQLALITVGEFPPGAQRELKETPLPLKKGAASIARSLLPQRSLPLKSHVDCLFGQRHGGDAYLPLYILGIRGQSGGETAAPVRTGHMIAFDLSAGRPSVFDPNFGWSPLDGTGLDAELDELLRAVWNYYRVDVGYLFQAMRTTEAVPRPPSACVIL